MKTSPNTPRKRKFMKKSHFARKPKIARSRRGKGKAKLVPLSKLKKALDAVFSQWNRVRFADKDGMVACYTNPKVKMHWTKAHNGHYLSRSYLNTRWNPDNCRPQSPGENIWKHGNPIVFRENLVKELGEGGVKYLEESRHVLFKPTRLFYETEIARYTKLLSELSTEESST